MTPDDTLPQRQARRFRISGPTLVLATAAVAVLAAISLFALFAWRDRVESFREADGLAANVAKLMAEHAGRLFETSDFILRQAIYLAGPAGSPIPSDRAAWRELVALSATTPYIVSIWIGDGDGHVLLTSRGHPAPAASAADRDYFKALQAGGPEPYISVLRDGGGSDLPLLVISRRLDSPPGALRGFAAIALTPDYFRNFYATIDIGYATIIELVKSDRRILVREPPIGVERLFEVRKTNEFAEAVARRPFGTMSLVSPVDGVERLNAFRRIDGFDAYVNVKIAKGEVHERWLARVWTYSYYGFAGLVALIVLAWFALQWARREEAAQAALRQVNDSLELRVQERTAALEEANRRLQGALADKEVLFREVHHRVKNNLQVIASLLRLQSSRLDQRSRRGFQESLNRIQSMGLVHELLYRSGEPARIDFAEYLRTLCDRLAESYKVPGERVRVEVTGGRMPLHLDLAVPLALILSELVSNALKHAFPDGRSGRVEVRLENDAEGIRVRVEDDGVGLPEEAASDGLGMQIVRALATQIEAEIEPAEGPGTAILVRLKRPATTGRAAS